MSDLITPSIYHRSIDGIELVKRREGKRMTQGQLAKRCGVSQGFISQLERPGVWEVTLKRAESLNRILGNNDDAEDEDCQI